ncbi:MULTISPECIES: hypothetical protein [Bacillus]|uniref:Uncharacterized protein n=1 Tax=Bacillus cereus TaxID=1396 RepID=A0A164PBP8_BACCE|nr:MULTISPECIES: hypothetical protein [Bacillus]KZD66761.1 hypothetical protein B4088_1972 [Bacillus cereus]TSI22019.1 hypothetical protein FOT98_05500 [Bacillus sp. HY001]
MRISDITNLESGVEYEEINCFSVEKLKKYAERQKKFAAKYTKSWSKEYKTEWILRNYLSTKMILSSTLLLNSLEFAAERNLRIVEPYLLYYSVLNTSRALLFADPSIEWRDGKLIRLTHHRIIAQTYESLRAISSEEADKVKFILEEAKGLRELFSYRFPARGISEVTNQSTNIEYAEVIKVCRLLTEVAQFNSEIFQVSREKNITEMIEIVTSDLNDGYVYKGYMKSEHKEEADCVFDQEDYYRLGYFIRKKLDPVNIYWIAREGLVEDFFGAWSLDEEDRAEDYFDPDDNWGLLLSPL